MADRQFDIEVLIKARNAASAVLNKFATDTKKADGEVKKLGATAKDTNKAMKQFGDRLEPVNERIKNFSKESLTLGNRLGSLNEKLKAANQNTSRYSTVVDNAVESQKKLNQTTKKLEKDLEGLGKAIRFAMGDTSDYVKVTAEMTKKNEEAAKSTETLTKTVHRQRTEVDETGNAFARFADRLIGIEHGGRRADASLRDLALSARGFVYAFAIKYAQALTSALVGLGGEAVAVAASMTSAGAAIGGAFTAGVLQAIPAVGLLIASLTRAAKIIEALNLRGTIKEGSGHRGRQDANEAVRDLDRITNAQESLADAQRDLARAQIELGKARREGRRELEDLIRAEREARLAARGAALSQEDAQRNLRAALSGGDVFAIRSAELDVDQGNAAVSEARVRASRAASDAARGRRGGVEGTDRVVNARRQLADAERRLAGATRDVARAQRESAISTAQNNAQMDRLKFLLDELSPAERRLFSALTRLQTVYKQAFRPITDIIVESFTEAVKGITQVVRDPSILQSFRELAGEIAKSIRRINSFGTSAENRSFVEFFVGQAAKNIPSLTTSFIGLSRVILRIGEAATPIFDSIVRLIDQITDGLLKVTGDQDGLNRFFDEAQDDLNALVELAKSLGRIFVAIFDPARDSGRESIIRTTNILNDLAGKLRDNEKGVRKFFDDSRRITVAVFNILRALAVEIAKIFNPTSVEQFSKVLINIFIPALGQAIRLLGVVTHAVQTFLNIPFVSDVTRLVFTIFLFTKALDILRRSLASIALVFAGLFGTASKGAGAFSVVARFAIILGSVMATLGVEIKGVGDILETFVGKAVVLLIGAGGLAFALNKLALQSAVFRGTIALQTAGALSGIQKFTRGAAARMTALRALFVTNPFGLLVTGITLAITALGLFSSSSEDTEDDVDSLTDALLAQRDAYRALRDAALDTRDAQLQVQSAELRLERSQIARNKLVKEIEKDGKVTKEERRQLREANIDLEQSEIDLTRARRRARDAKEDERTTAKRAQEESKKTLTAAKEEVKTLREQKQESDERLENLRAREKSLADQIKAGLVPRNRMADLTKNINDEQDKNRNITKRLKNANVELNDALRTAGRGFFQLGRNADSFGLTFSDVLKFLEKGANNALGAFGAKKVKIALDYIKNSNYYISDFPEKRAQGGIIDGQGLMDSVHVMAAPGEGFLTRHQMPIVDTALRASGMMQGGLGELFSRVQTPHYMAKGGFVQGAVSEGLGPAAMNFAERMFKLGFSVTSAFRRGDPRQHGRGEALDFGDSVNDLGKLWRVVFPIRRQLNQLLGPQGLYNGVRRFYDQTLQNQHNDHIHVGFRNTVSGMLGSLNEAIGRVKLSGGPGGYMMDILRGAERRIRNAGQTFVDKKSAEFGDKPNNLDFKKIAKGSLSVNQVRGIAAQALRRLGIKENVLDWQQMLVARAYQESNFNPNAVNRWDSNAQRGTPSRGLMQTIDSTFRAYALPKLQSIFNPLHNMIAAIRYMIERYGKGNQAVALQAMLGRNAAKIGYSRGGAVQRFNVGGVPGADRYTPKGSGTSGVPAIFDNPFFRPIIRDLNKALNKIKDGKFIKGLSDLTAENGVLARFFDALKTTTERIAARITRGHIKVGNDGTITIGRSGESAATAELGGLQESQGILLAGRGELSDARKGAESAVDKAERAVRKARKDGDKKALAAANKRLTQARAGLQGVKQAQNDLEDSITSNAQDIIAKQLEITQLQVDAVDRTAGFSLNRASRLGRIADVIRGTTAGGIFSSLATQRTSLLDTGSALTTQRAGLESARARALALGQTELFKDLTERIEDLDTTIAENNLALQQNTDAQRDANVQNILQRSGFLTGINSSAISFFQGIASLTGTNQNSSISSLLGSSNTTLRNASTGLLGELNLILQSIGAGNISGTGAGLVNSLVGLSSMDTSNLTPEGQARFQQLIEALINNETAINSNTEQINSLTSTVGQAFETTSWQLFREAVFNGAGGLLPEFQSTVPQMAEGGIVQRNGLFYLHSGEKVTPRSQVNDNKEEHKWYITSPTEIADPDYFATLFSFKRSTQRAN